MIDVRNNPALPYKVEVTRVHKGNYAPTGKCYVVVRYKAARMKYESYLLVISERLTDDALGKVSVEMWNQLVKKYSL